MNFDTCAALSSKYKQRGGEDFGDADTAHAVQPQNAPILRPL